MSWLVFILELYFAMLLGVSALAKVDDPQHFAQTLRQQKILPTWSISATSRVVPLIEISIAILLVLGITEVITAILVLVLFVIFLGIKVFLLMTKSEAGCGCNGVTKQEKVDGISVLISTILVLLIVVQLWLVALRASVSLQWRLIECVIFLGVVGFLLLKIILKHRAYNPQALTPPSSSIMGGPEVGSRAPSFVAVDQNGNIISLDDSQGRQRLLFVSPGCPACHGALKALHLVLQEKRDLIGLVVGSPDQENNKAYIIEQDVLDPFLTPDVDLVEKTYDLKGFPVALVGPH